VAAGRRRPPDETAGDIGPVVGTRRSGDGRREVRDRLREIHREEHRKSTNARPGSGKVESPLGSNNVKYNTWFYGTKVDGAQFMWCAVYQAWTAAAAKIPMSVIPKRADVPGMRDFFKARGRLHEMPMAGDLSIWIFSPSMRHIGFVETVAADGRNFTTIEGNVNSRVVRRDHRVGESGLVGFGRPDYAKVEEDDMPDEKTFKKWVREAVKEELEERWKGGVVKGQRTSVALSPSSPTMSTACSRRSEGSRLPILSFSYQGSVRETIQVIG
jgi:hypothetical protein